MTVLSFSPKTRFLRSLAVCIACTLGVGELWAQADAAEAAVLPADLRTELEALEKPGWILSGATRVSAGYRDNVLLSAFAPEGRAFLDGQVEVLGWRPATSVWEWLAFLNADVLRYFSSAPGANGEQQWFGQGELRWVPTARTRVGLSVQGYYQDMVVDLSETDAQRIVAPIKAQGTMATLSARLGMPWHLSLEPSVREHRSDYRDYPGDYREFKIGARLEWKRWTWLALSAAWHQVQRHYRDRNQYTAGGRALPGTRLGFDQDEGELKATSGFTAGGRWVLTASVGRMRNRDGASGYFNYNRRQARLGVEWQGERWSVSAEGTAQRFDYLVQTVGIGIAPPARIADTYDTTLRVERKLAPRWIAFAEGRWERNRSNEAEFAYRSGTGLAGVSREF